ncbi:MAG: hypothetical protein GXY15_10305 [Candidatus Hydrogenedentes bacterium]|nr:hypothetical protein [Candidatus Hydrogenedentota bacterium]
MGPVAALLLCCGWAQGHYAVPEYILPCELSKWESSACGAARPEVPAEMPTLPPPLQEVVRLLVEEYKQTSPEERSFYARRLPQTLLYLGPETAPLAFAMLCDEDKEVRSVAVEAVCDALCAPLFKTPEAAACVESALPACLNALKNGPEVVRMTLGFALCMTGLPPERIRPALLEALNDPSVRVQACVAKGLDWSIKKSPRPPVDPGDIALSPELITYFCGIIRSARGIDEGVFGLAFPVLPAQQDQKRAFLSELLASPDPYVREYAFPHLHAAGEDGMGLFPQASEVLRRLSGIGPAPADTAARSPEEEYVLTVIGLLDSKFQYFRLRGLGYLKGLGDRARPAAPRLLKALHARDWEVRHGAFHLLKTPPFEGVLTVDTLRGLFQEKDDAQLLVLSIQRLGEMGAAAAEAAPELFSALRHSDPEVRCAAAAALARVLPQDDRVTAASLDALLGWEGEGCGQDFTEGLMAQGKASASAASLIAARYRDLLRASGNIPHPAADRLPGVLAALGGDSLRVAAEGLEGGDARVRAKTLEALAQSGERARFALDSVLSLTASADLNLRVAALKALPALAPEDRKVRRAVLAALSDKEDRVAGAGIFASLSTRFSRNETRRVESLLLHILKTRVASGNDILLAPKYSDPPVPTFLSSALAKHCQARSEELTSLIFHENPTVSCQAQQAALPAGIPLEDVRDRMLNTLRREGRMDDIPFMLKAGVSRAEIAANVTAAMRKAESKKVFMPLLQFLGREASSAIPDLIAIMQPDVPFDLGMRGAILAPRMTAFYVLPDIGYDNDQVVAAMIAFARNSSGPRRRLLGGFDRVLNYRLGLLEPPAYFDSLRGGAPRPSEGASDGSVGSD